MYWLARRIGFMISILAFQHGKPRYLQLEIEIFSKLTYQSLWLLRSICHHSPFICSLGCLVCTPQYDQAKQRSRSASDRPRNFSSEQEVHAGRVCRVGQARSAGWIPSHRHCQALQQRALDRQSHKGKFPPLKNGSSGPTEHSELFQESKLKREEIFLTDKVPPENMGYEKTLKAFESSCKQLRVDYIGKTAFGSLRL